jgi:DNA polymerase-1
MTTSSTIPRPSEVLPDKDGLAVAVDTETSGTHTDDGARLSVISVAYLDDNDQVVAWAFPFDQGSIGKPGQSASLFDELDAEINLPEAEWDWLFDWLERQRLIFHNAKFDLPILRIGTRHWLGRDLTHRLTWDTMVVQKEIEPQLSLGLKEISARWGFLGGGERDHEAAVKAWLKKNKKAAGRYDLVPWELMGPYASRDAELTIYLYLLQRNLIDEGRARPQRVAHRMAALHVLAAMERRGIGYDAGASLAVADQITQMVRELEQDLPFRNTLPAAKAYFFGDNGKGGVCVPYATTAKNNPVLDIEIARKMVRDQIPYAKEYAEITKLDHARSMWYQGYPEKIGDDGRLRTIFKQTSVRSGRLASERMNLQAIPKTDKTVEGLPDVRSFFRARPGYRLWNLDLSQAELRCAARYAGCVRMLEMLEGGADLHSITTEEVMGVAPDHPKHKVFRDIGKRLTFGGIFQIGGRTFQATLSKEGIEMSLEECDLWVANWRSMYPEYGTAYRRSEQMVLHHGFVKLLPGTPFESLSWFGLRDFPNTAWSRRVQGSLAEFLQIWLIETEALLQGSPDEDVREALVLTVHDSLVLELPDDGRDEEWANRIAAAGAKRATALFDIEMKVDVGPWHK